MIRQQPGDVLEIEYEGRWYYLVVVTKIIMFGGNVVYAFHGDGQKIANFTANPSLPGFNICTDLLLPKKEGAVRRIGKVGEPNDYLVSPLMKACHEHRPGFKAKEWWIYSVDNPTEHVARTKQLAPEQKKAMDRTTYPFDLAAQKILCKYTPDKNPFI